MSKHNLQTVLVASVLGVFALVTATTAVSILNKASSQLEQSFNPKADQGDERAKED